MFLLTVSKDNYAGYLFLEYVSSRVRHLPHARSNAQGMAFCRWMRIQSRRAYSCYRCGIGPELNVEEVG